ncbi:MAG: peptide chain release factor N(5)-glutamine methyltransferase [Pyrinomonadaceae bacterium]
MNIAEAIRDAAVLLSESGVDGPRREAALLVSLSVGKDRTFLIAHPEYKLTRSEETRLDDLVRRRANREPFQYISGIQEFFGLEFDVSPAVLIPRPETEILVERAIGILSKQGQSQFLEIGVGSGCIAVSTLVNCETTSGTAVDLSSAALDVARGNAARHRVADRLNLSISDVYASIHPGVFDLIVSNPPYVPAADIERLQPEVRDFEPRDSLTDGDNGLSIIQRIIDGAPPFLKPSGELLIEIGYGQSKLVTEMFNKRFWLPPELLLDLQGIERIVRAVRHPK